jgi:hypothetical protein
MLTGSCNWDRKIKSAKQRFKVLTVFNSEAVLDRETGLVWERTPSVEAMAWPNARLFCAQKSVGGRGGWRLPAFSELASLIDTSVLASETIRLPRGHPFLDVQLTAYWSATSVAAEPGFAFIVNFFVPVGGTPTVVTDANTGGTSCPAWAVRGGSPGPATY